MIMESSLRLSDWKGLCQKLAVTTRGSNEAGIARTSVLAPPWLFF
jgi:hypothetical protein